MGIRTAYAEALYHDLLPVVAARNERLGRKSLIRMANRSPTVFRKDGTTLDPGDVVVPILKEVGYRKLKVVGTGFFVTRYGLFLTAKHVLEDLVTSDGVSIGRAFVCHLAGADQIHLRPIVRAHLLKGADVGAGQAENYLNDAAVPLQNHHGVLSNTLPVEGTPLVTFGYPENAILDFGTVGSIPKIQGDYAVGGYLRYVLSPEYPPLGFPCFESSIQLLSGASGGPVFANGLIIGINCRGWDFRGVEPAVDPLSYIVPIELALDLEVDLTQVPPQSWEDRQIPPARRGQPFTIRELVRIGHIVVEPTD